MLTDEQIAELDEQIKQLEANDVYNVLASACLRMLDFPPHSMTFVCVQMECAKILQLMQTAQDILKLQESGKAKDSNSNPKQRDGEHGPGDESNRGEVK